MPTTNVQPSILVKQYSELVEKEFVQVQVEIFVKQYTKEFTTTKHW